MNNLNLQRMTHLNATMLTACALLGLFANIAHDFFGSKISVYVALLAWLTAVIMALYFCGKTENGINFISAIKNGLSNVKNDKLFSIAIVILSAGSVYSAYSSSKVTLSDVNQNVIATKDAVEKGNTTSQKILDKVSEEVSPKEVLVKMGYTTQDEDVCRAMTEGDAKALALMAQIVTRPIKISESPDSEYCLESALLSDKYSMGFLKNSYFKLNVAEFNHPHITAVFTMDSPGKVNLSEIYKLGGLNGKNAKIIMFRSTALLLAIYGGNIDNIKSLIDYGVDVNAKSSISGYVETQGKSYASMYTADVTPLFEAKRLKLDEIAALIEKSGGKSSVTVNKG